MDDLALVALAQAQVLAEAEAVRKTAAHLNDAFVQLARRVAGCTGKVIVTGAGTSGAIAYRLAHLLATCGVTAFSVPPGDALHGESAMLVADDLLIVLSKAGKSADINQFASIAKQRGAWVCAWTAEAISALAQLADLVLLLPTDVAGEGEGVLPFGSTLTAGAVGDALVLVVQRLRGFDLATMAQTHPSGGAADLVQRPKTAS